MGLEPNLRLYWDTVRFLRPSQIMHLVVRRIGERRFKLDGPFPKFRQASSSWSEPAWRSASWPSRTEVCLLNQTRGLDAPIDWQDSSNTLLWLYNLHYFDDLTAVGAEKRVDFHVELIEDWVQRNPAAQGVGWEPYPTSLRIVNWIKWTLGKGLLNAKAQESLVQQLRCLRSRLEHHLLGNHLWANAKALVFGGFAFEGIEAARWQAEGLRLIAEMLSEHLLEDGGHIERSPMYHSIVLGDLLDLIQIHRSFDEVVPQDWLLAVSKMQQWLRGLSHPDGQIAFFNDATFEVAPDVGTHERYMRSLGIEAAPASSRPLQMFETSGFVRANLGKAALIVECGSVGPDHQPGHAHAGTLSFELSLGGERVFVNSGISEYGVGLERQRQRGTRAHNTLCIDERDSSEVWAGFRVARRARVKDAFSAIRDNAIIARASHNGYTRLRGAPRHERSWILRESGLEIVDSIAGAGTHSLEVGFLIHPTLKAVREGPDVVLTSQEGRYIATVRMRGDTPAQLEASTFHPGFNITMPTTRVVLRCRAALPFEMATEIAW